MATQRYAQKILSGWMLVGLVLGGLGLSLPVGTLLPPASAAATQTQTTADLQDFALVSASTGWVQMGRHLYWTVDDGAVWQDITPALPDSATLLSVTFLDARTGKVLWANPNAKGGLSLQLSSTFDAGAQWTVHPIQLLSSTDLDVNVESASMDWLNPSIGWVSIKRQTSSNFSAGALFHTLDGGESWIRSELPIGGPVHFADALAGWMTGGPANDQIFQTADGGLTWTEQPLPAGLTAAQVYELYPPVFDSPQAGLLGATTIEADIFQLRFFTTADAGQTWNSLASFPLNSQPGRVPVSLLHQQGALATVPGDNRSFRLVGGERQTLTNSGGLSAGIVDLRMLSVDLGWARWNLSSCTKTVSPASSDTTEIDCTASTRLLETADGGLTWKAILLPEIHATTFTRTTSASSTSISQVTAASAANTQIYIGKGFDVCGLPSLAALNVWDDFSPYAAMNLYIGGSMLFDGCEETPLTAAYVATAYSYGWKFIPTWVGPQAPCTSYKYKIAKDVNQAYLEGINEANQAIDTLAALGLTAADKSGSIVYYDLEAFVGDQACRDQVKAFMNGWDYQLKQYRNLSGVYGSTLCINGLNNFLSIDNKPDAIWGAIWDDRATVWGLGCISDSVWSSHQRIHQYAGDHNETYGDAAHGRFTLGIDNDALDGIVAIPNQVVIPLPPSAIFLATPTSGTGPLTVLFHINNPANITACSWVYGDGQTGTTCAQDHLHVYNTSGSYSVTLTVNGPGGSDDLTRANYILVNEPSQADLIPYPLGSAASPVVISSVTGTNVNDTLYVDQPVFIDWGLKNIGTSDIPGGFNADLYIDGQRILDYSFIGLGQNETAGEADTTATWNSAGWHTVRLVVDPLNTVPESNENNNSWTSQFYWQSSSPVGPTVLEPVGVITTNKPVFKWIPPASTNVVMYKLYLNSLSPGGLRVEANIPSTPPTCVNQLCQSPSHSDLTTYGDYEFKVGAVDFYGVITYSPWITFTYTNTPPSAPTIVSPSGSIKDPVPAYSWTKSNYASWYEMQVFPAGSGTPLYSTTSIPALASCVGGTCTWTAPVLLPRGNYEFKLRAANMVGFSSYVNGSFYVNIDLTKYYLPYTTR